jgi:6-phosphogluconolactonase (cycloisomerase 2 family)
MNEGHSWQEIACLDGITNPSYLLADPARQVIFAAHGDAEFASSYAIDVESGRVSPLGQTASGGKNGVSVALHPSGRFLFVANYSSGSITTLPVEADGSLRDAAHRFELPGPTGPHRGEQDMSHPHDTIFDPSNRFLIVPDKGLDRVFVLGINNDDGRLLEISHVTLRAGSGPRHIKFHSTLPLAFVINEIDSTVAILRWDAEAGILVPLHVTAALPSIFFGENTAAEIVIDRSGRFIYASNRGKNVVTHFALSDGGEELHPVGWTSTQGRTPRFMTLSPNGEWLLVANEQSDTIVAFSINEKDGTLAPKMTLATASPSSIVFL